jgi:predicted alpha/beta-fold hydrolase
MGSGPKAERDFDLALTELDPAGDHRFLVEVGSDLGRDLLATLPHRKSAQADVDAALAVSARTSASMTRRMPDDVQNLLTDRDRYGWE